MISLFLFATLNVSAADELAPLRKALGYARSAAQAAKPDLFSLDPARTPAYVAATIEERSAEKGKTSKAELRLEIARLQNSIDEAFEKNGLGCQQRLDAAIARHAAYRANVPGDMAEIHAVLVKLRDSIAAGIAAGTGKRGSLAEEIESVRESLAAERAARGHASPGPSAYAAEERLKRKFAAELSAAKAELEALAAAKGLVEINPYHTVRFELYLSFYDQEPNIQLHTPIYWHKAHKAEYFVFVRKSLVSGKATGDSLEDALSDGQKNSFEVASPLEKYAPVMIHDCVALAAAQRALAAKP